MAKSLSVRPSACFNTTHRFRKNLMWVCTKICNVNLILFDVILPVDRESSVGTATLYGLDGPGIESR